MLLSSLDFFSTKVTTSSIILLPATLWCGKPERYIIWLPWPPPVNPIWVWDASPGPLTTHPIIDSVIGATIQAQYYCDECKKFTELQIHHEKKNRLISGFGFVDNNIVNLLATTIGSGLSILIIIVFLFNL